MYVGQEKYRQNYLFVYTGYMGLFSFLRKSDTAAHSQLSVAVDAPQAVYPSQGVVSVSVAISSGNEAARVTSVYVQLIEKYDRHTEDFQQTADNFHEVKAEAQETNVLSIAPRTTELIHFQLDITGLRHQSSDVVQDNLAGKQPVTKILHTGPEVANVLRLGDNKENVHYILKTIVEANGASVSPPTQRITIQS